MYSFVLLCHNARSTFISLTYTERGIIYQLCSTTYHWAACDAQCDALQRLRGRRALFHPEQLLMQTKNLSLQELRYIECPSVA